MINWTERPGMVLGLVQGTVEFCIEVSGCGAILHAPRSETRHTGVPEAKLAAERILVGGLYATDQAAGEGPSRVGPTGARPARL
jgi:hypothetical protein